MNRLIFALVLFSTSNLYAQSNTLAIEEEEVQFKIVDVTAHPYGGYEKFYKYVSKKLKYPKSARKAGQQGIVYVQFVINEDGSVNEQSVRTLTHDEVEESPQVFNPENHLINEACEQKVIDIIKNMPDWKPAEDKGENVTARIILPITFKL